MIFGIPISVREHFDRAIARCFETKMYHYRGRNKRNTDAPPELDRNELKEALDFCAVLEPLKLSTKLLEGDEKSLASLYLPVWTKALETLEQTGNKILPYPRELREAFGPGVKCKDLCEKAVRMKLFLANDLRKVRKRHLEGTNGEKLLVASTFLDPRFRGHSVFKTLQPLKGASDIVADIALKTCQKYPELLERLQKQADDPENTVFARLADPEKGRGKGKRKGRSTAAKAKSKSEARLRKEQEPGPVRPKRKLKEQTSADEWLFGAPGVEKDSEAKVLGDLREVEASIQREIELYQRLPATDKGPLAWWKANGVQLPYLATCALRLFGLPASTASLERLFSSCGRGITRRKPRLQPKNAANIIYGHANVRFGYNGVNLEE